MKRPTDVFEADLSRIVAAQKKHDEWRVQGMKSMEVPGRPDPDHLYRRFTPRSWYAFFQDLTGESVLHAPEGQECPFCNAPGALAIVPARVMAPPRFRCDVCDRNGDILDFIAEYENFRLEPRTAALDYLWKWADKQDLPEVAAERPRLVHSSDEHQETRDKRFEVLRIKDFLDQPIVPALIANVLPSAQVSVLFGELNSFKSFLAIDMLCSVATGRSWHSFPVDPGPVLYIVTEGAHDAVAKRIVGWFEDKGISLDIGNAMIGIIKVPVIMNRIGDVDALIATIKERLPGCKLAVFDLLAGSMEGSEADSEAVTGWVRGTQRLADELICTQLHVTHSGYSDSTRGRGHSHLWGSFSTRLKAEGNREARTTYLSVERHKDWDAAGLGWSFDLAQIPVGIGHETTLVPRLREGVSAPGLQVGAYAGKKLPKGLKYLRQALDAVMDTAVSLRPFPDGPLVRAVRLDTIQAEFVRRYPIADGSEAQKANTRLKAWQAALAYAGDLTNGQVGYREIDEIQWLWPV